MHIPTDFLEERPARIAEWVDQARVGELVTLGAEGLEATTLPLLAERSGDKWRLVGHLARANPQWRHARPEVEALVIFRHADAYISPSAYPSKREHGRVVPTWDYAEVQARGSLVVHDDPTWVEALVRALTGRHEQDRLFPWSVDDAPADFVSAQLRAIVGVEIPVRTIVAKAKLSQNRPLPDTLGAAADLEHGGEGDQRVASLVREAASMRTGTTSATR